MMAASPFSRWMMMGSSVFTFVLLSLPKINFALHRTGDRWLAVHISQRIVFPKRPKNPAEVIHLILRVLNYYCLLQGFLHHLMQRNLPRPFLSGSLIPRRPHSLRGAHIGFNNISSRCPLKSSIYNEEYSPRTVSIFISFISFGISHFSN